jgi:hypothetical protein
MYIVISNPQRMSLACGFSQVMMISFKVGWISGQVTNPDDTLCDLFRLEWQRQIHEYPLMIFMILGCGFC